MRIDCPFCGLRDLAEFSYCGDAANAAARPEPSHDNSDTWNSWVYDRTNPMGDHTELWQHTGGCRQFLRITRNTVSHNVSAITMLEPSQ